MLFQDATIDRSLKVLRRFSHIKANTTSWIFLSGWLNHDGEMVKRFINQFLTTQHPAGNPAITQPLLQFLFRPSKQVFLWLRAILSALEISSHPVPRPETISKVLNLLCKEFIEAQTFGLISFDLKPMKSQLKDFHRAKEGGCWRLDIEKCLFRTWRNIWIALYPWTLPQNIFFKLVKVIHDFCAVDWYGEEVCKRCPLTGWIDQHLDPCFGRVHTPPLAPIYNWKMMGIFEKHGTQVPTSQSMGWNSIS